MNRIDIVYGGKPYSLGGRSVESIQVEIDGALAAGLPYWLRVNSGEGRFEDAYLLIAPGISVAMVNVKPNGVDPEHENEPEGDELYEED
jgi:hypothetical protein